MFQKNGDKWGCVLDNLKVVLSQQKKLLIIFFVVVFFPSIVLAFFGIKAIYIERYKLQQQYVKQQKEFVWLFRLAWSQ